MRKDRHIFKAKTLKSKKWVVGYLVESNIISFNKKRIKKETKIDINTVCCSTGRKDLNNNIIFEEDLVLINGLEFVIHEYNYNELLTNPSECLIVGNVYEIKEEN